MRFSNRIKNDRPEICARCGCTKRYPKEMSYIEIGPSLKLSSKGYDDRFIKLCDRCTKKLYEFLDIEP